MTIAPYLPALQELTLTYPRGLSASEVRMYFDALSGLMESLGNLRSFTLYAPGGTAGVEGHADDELTFSSSDEEDFHRHGHGHGHGHGHHQHHTHIPMSGPALDMPFFRALLSSRGRALRTLRLYGMGMSLGQLDLLTRVAGIPDPSSLCTRRLEHGDLEHGGQLENLVVHLYERDEGGRKAARCLARLPRLCTLHILSSVRSHCLFSVDDLAHLAGCAAPTLRQIGFRHQVWTVRWFWVLFCPVVLIPGPVHSVRVFGGGVCTF